MSVNSSSELRIAVVSDLHAYAPQGDGPAPSHLDITLSENEPGQHPIAGLRKLIQDNKLATDLLLCAGDLGDKANIAGIQYAWKAIHQIGGELGSKLIAATSGNHDLDSRYIHSFDAKGTLLGLTPSYPFQDEHLSNKYWAKNFAICNGDTYRLVVLNSSAYHGMHDGEFEHGRIADSTLNFLTQELSIQDPKPINLLLCHHHPQQHMELKLGDYDVMKNGQILLDLLGSGDFGRWLVIHGHKHHPKIAYSAGSAISPVVFSAGSLCANLYLELQTMARNQFYLISLPYEDIESLGMVGTVKAWDWASGLGWGPAAGITSGLPSSCAFGFRGDPLILAKKIAKFVTNGKAKWSDVECEIQGVKYLLSQDRASLKKELEIKHQLTITEENGIPREVGKVSW